MFPPSWPQAPYSEWVAALVAAQSGQDIAAGSGDEGAGGGGDGDEEGQGGGRFGVLGPLEPTEAELADLDKARILGPRKF